MLRNVSVSLTYHRSALHRQHVHLLSFAVRTRPRGGPRPTWLISVRFRLSNCGNPWSCVSAWVFVLSVCQNNQTLEQKPAMCLLTSAWSYWTKRWLSNPFVAALLDAIKIYRLSDPWSQIWSYRVLSATLMVSIGAMFPSFDQWYGQTMSKVMSDLIYLPSGCLSPITYSFYVNGGDFVVSVKAFSWCWSSWLLRSHWYSSGYTADSLVSVLGLFATLSVYRAMKRQQI